MNQYIDKLPYNDFVNICKFNYENKESTLNKYAINYLNNCYFKSQFYDGFIAKWIRT